MLCGIDEWLVSLVGKDVAATCILLLLSLRSVDFAKKNGNCSADRDFNANARTSDVCA